MKIDKKNPKHWLYLLRSIIYISFSILLRAFWHRKGQNRITLYGHKYNGNLKTFADYALEKNKYTISFATLDPEYYAELLKSNLDVEILYLQSFKDVLKISKSVAIITDRWAPTLSPFIYLRIIPFFDVWHGIQIFKKFKQDELDMYKKYTEIWTSSEALADVYVNDYGFSKNQVAVTGYGRVDPLINKTYQASELKKKYNVPANYDRVILLAPTWQQDDPSRQVIPFGEDPDRFLGALNNVAERHNSLIIFRAHLNTNTQNNSKLHNLKNIIVMSHNDYPLGEEFLSFSDMLIGDWSSIAFEFLPLHRPTIFLDVPIPFSEGLTFGIENRFGEVVSSLDELVSAIEQYSTEPGSYMKEHGKQVQLTEQLAFGNTLDGKSNERYYNRLQHYLDKNN